MATFKQEVDKRWSLWHALDANGKDSLRTLNGLRCVHKLNRTAVDVDEHKRASDLVCMEYKLRQKDSQLLEVNALEQAQFQRLFEDNIDLFGRAYWEVFRDAVIVSKSGADHADALRKNLKEVLEMLMECRHWGEEWVEHAQGNLIKSLLALSECLIEVACHCFYEDKEVRSKKDQLKPKKEKEKDKPVVAPLHLHSQLAHELLSNGKDLPGVQLFALLTSVALQRASEAVELHNHGCTAGLDFLNQGNNIIFLCCALVFSCQCFGSMMEKQPMQVLHYSTPTKIAIHDEDFKIFMADLECVAQERPALYWSPTSFFQKVHKKWAAGMKEWGDKHKSACIVDCVVSQEKFKDEAKEAQHMWHEAMRCLCIQYPLAQHGKDVAFSFENFFEDSIDSLGRALWEFLQVMNTPRKQEIVLESEAAIKALMNCKKDRGGWKEKYRDSLAVRLRRLSEALLKATCLHLDPSPPPTMVELLRERRPDQVRWIATLCNAANNIASSIEIHHEKGAEQKAFYENLDSNVVMVCHCTTFAIMWYASLIRAGQTMRDVDASPENMSCFLEYLQHLMESNKAEADEEVHVGTFLEECKKLTDAYKIAIRQAESTDHQAFIHTFNTESIWVAQLLEHVQWSKMITQMYDIKRELQRYQRDFSSATWLHRLIRKEEERHHNYILKKLEKVIVLLQSKSDVRLKGLEEKIANFRRGRQELMESNKKAREQLDSWGHIRDLQEIVAEISEGRMTEADGKDDDRVRQALQQAAAYWQAINDEDGEHHAINHPDLLVMWHRVEALRKKWAADWDDFWESFPSKLVVPHDYRDKVRKLLRKCRHLLEEHLARSGPEAGSMHDSEDEWVTIESVNLVFQWNELKRLGVLEAIQECQRKASSPASSEFSGPATPSIQDVYAKPSSVNVDGDSSASVAFRDSEDTDFIGRKRDMEFVISTLTIAKRNVLITGPGGIGKSAIGSRAAAKLESQHQVFSVDLFSADTKERVLEYCASRLHVVGKAETIEDEMANIVHRLQILASNHVPPQKGILLRLDSCEIPLANHGASRVLMELLEHVARRVPQVLMLLAVRISDKADDNKQMLQRFLNSRICVFEEVAIAPLDSDSAKLLILREGFREEGLGEHNEKAKELAEICGCIPLRLRLAASVLSAGQVKFEDIKAVLKADTETTLEQAILVWHADVHLHALYRLSLFAASFSTEHALYMLGDFDYREQLLQELYSRRLVVAEAESGKLAWGLHANVRMAIQSLGSSEGWQERRDAAGIMFAECMMAELIKSARVASRGQLGMASSIALSQQSNISAALGVAEHNEEICTTVLQSLLQHWPLFASGDWLLCIGRVAALLIPSMEQLAQAWKDAVQEAFEGQAEVEGGGGEPWSGSGRFESGLAMDDTEKWRKWMSDNVLPKPGGVGPLRLVFLVTSKLSEKQFMLADVLFVFGCVLNLQGKWGEAEVRHREMLNLCDQVMGPKHPYTLIGMNNLASALGSQGKWCEAEALHREVLELSKQVKGPEHPDTLTSMHSLEDAFDSQGKWGEAEVRHREVLELSKKVKGPEHPDTLTSMNNLASALDSQGKWGEAEVMLQEVLELSKKVKGPEHPGTLTSMNNLANTLNRQGKWSEAEVRHREVLELSKKVKGPEHPDTLIRMNNLASTLDSQGKWGEAEVILKEVLELTKKVMGPEHPDTLTSKSSLASALNRQGKCGEAEAMLREVVKLSKQVMGPEHPHTLTSMHSLADAVGSLGKWDEAEVMHREVLELSKRVKGPEHPDTLSSMHNLASALGSQGKWGEAEVLHRVELELSKKVMGPKHPLTLTSMHSLADVLGSLGKWDEAEVMHRAELELSKQVKGLEHPDTLTSMNSLANSLVRQGKWGEAEALHRKGVELSKKVKGLEHPDTLTSMNNLATVLVERGKWAEAAIGYREVIATSCKVWGSEDPCTASFCRSLKADLWNWARNGSNLETPDIPVFLEAALATTQSVPDTASSRPWPQYIELWCKFLASNGAKKEAHTLAVQASEQFRMKLGRSHGDTKACKKLEKKYS